MLWVRITQNKCIFKRSWSSSGVEMTKNAFFYAYG